MLIERGKNYLFSETVEGRERVGERGVGGGGASRMGQ